ncbi:MAG: hypothetical protein ACRDKZ_08240 [Actinomycetota bacterium]
MVLAHTLGTGGPDLELIMLAAALAVLGVIFFFQKAVKPSVSVIMLIAAIGAGAGAFALGGSQTAASGGPTDATISITSPSVGDSVPAKEALTLEYELSGAEVAESQDDVDKGHLHVYVDDQLFSMPVGGPPTVTLPPGEHKVGLEFSAPDHASYDPPVIDEVEVTAE